MLKDLSSFLRKSDLLGQLPATSIKEKIKEGENRFVSILFADIVGFTDMSELLDHEVVQELFDQLMISFSEMVARYGGYVDKYEGDLIMAHFGSRDYQEQVSRRAVYAGLEIINVIKHYNEIRGTIPELAAIKSDLGIRVGINSGWVTTGKIGLKREGDFTVYGDVVNLASRMESNGVPNRIMLPLSVRKELEPYFEFNYHGSKEIKGIKGDIPLYLVNGIKRDIVSREVSDSGFVGRDAVMQRLSEVYHQNNTLLENPILNLVGIRAAAGMGKTRLSREFCKTLDSKAYISEISPLTQNPYSCFSALLRSIFGLASICSEAAIKDEFAKGFNDLLSALPAGSAELLRDQESVYYELLGIDIEINEADPQERKSAINYALLILIRGIAEKYQLKGLPLLIIFEDLHFADELSINALNYLIKNLFLHELTDVQPAFRIILIMLYRETFTPAQLILDYPTFEEIELRELDSFEIEQFIGLKINDTTMKERLLPQILRKSAGNPMFIEEWLHLLYDNLEEGTEPDWDSISIPNNIAALILIRLNNLVPQARQYVQHASTIGMCFREYLLRLLEADLQSCAASEITLESIYTSDVLIRTGDSNDDESLSFRHELYHQTIYNTLLKSNRKILHGIVAEIIEHEYPDELKNWYFALAEHYEKSCNIEKCLTYLHKSVDYAHSLFMNKKEMELCEKLIKYSPLTEVVEINLRKASLYLDMGDYIAAEDILGNTSFQTLEPGLLRDKYFLACMRMLLTRYDLKIAREYIDLHLPEITTDLAKTTGMIYQLDARRMDMNDKEFIADAQGILHKLDTSQSQYSRLENIIGLFHSNRSEYSKAVEYFDNAILHSQQHKIILKWAHQNKANVLCKLGRSEEAMAEYNIALYLARYMDDESGICKLLCDMGSHCLETGDDKQALQMFNESCNISIRTGNLKQQGLSEYNLAKLYDSIDDLPNARKMLSNSLKISYKLSNHQALSHGRDLLGDILYREGKIDYARKVYQSNLAFQQEIHDNEGIAHTYGNLGNIAADNKDFDKAEDYYRIQQTMLNQIGDIVGEGKAWYNWGLLDAECGKTEQSIEKMKAALNLFEKGGFTTYIEAAKEYLNGQKDR